MSSKIASVLSAVLLTALISPGCSKLPSVHLDSPFGKSNWVELHDARVVTDPAPALAVTVVNLTDKQLSVRVVIDEIEGRDDCQNSFRLISEQSVDYSCEQIFVAEGKRFRAEILVYKDWGQTKLAERIRRLIEIETGEDGGLVLVGRPVD